MAQGLVTFTGIDNIQGGEMTHIRGVRPSTCMLHVIPPLSTLNSGASGTLTFTYGTSTVQFPECRVVDIVQENFPPRGGRDYHVKIYDRRWKWRYVKVDGHYNARSPEGTVQTFYKKNARELATILLDALGETGYDVSAVSDAVYPLALWNRARADMELEWLCDLLGLIVVLKLDNTVSIEPLNDSAGATLPAGGTATTPAEYAWKSGVYPDTLRVQGDPTIIQSELTLTPAYLESSSYTIRDDDWPEWHAAINTSHRFYAYLSGLRYFRPSGGWDGDGETISDWRQIEIQDRLVQEGSVASDLVPLEPIIKGDFWMYGEFNDTTSNEYFTGKVELLPGRRIVKTDRPLFKISGNQILAPTIKLLCAYKVIKQDGSGYSTYTKDKSVTTTGGSGTRVLNRPELQKRKIVDSFGTGSASDNKTALDTEADIYLDGVDATYGGGDIQSVSYNGIVDQDLDGAISQIKWRAGFGLAAKTVIGRFTEFDIYTQHWQARRAANRLIQLSERFSL